jgi:hypothetical protein
LLLSNINKILHRRNVCHLGCLVAIFLPLRVIAWFPSPYLNAIT